MTKEKTKKRSKLKVEDLGKAGLHFGHGTSKRNLGMEPYIEGVKGPIHIIDLKKTIEKMEEALDFFEKVSKEEKTILVVATRPQMKDLVEEFSKECSLPYITNRWIGGFISNFSEVKKRIKYLNDLLEKKEKGELDKYTKKVRVEIDREIERLEKKFGGVKKLTALPDVLFVIDVGKDYLALKEARDKGIETVGVVDTDNDPKVVDYPIPANDDAISSVRFILEKVKEVIKK